ncbi:MAG: methyltransferase [Candidatus Korobacteraceae bacterium]
MRALAGEGIFAVDDLGRFSLTPASAILQTDVPGSLHDWALLMLGEVHQEAWTEVIHSVRTGQSAFPHRFGMDLWQYRSNHPGYAKLFDAAMASFTMTYIDNLLTNYSFSTFRRIIDVGGGDGSLLIAILQANREIQGIVYDLPDVAERARQRIDNVGLANRCQVSSGNAFVKVPKGGDAYILSRVLHDWDDDSACKILSSCRNVLPADGLILVIERALPDNLRQTVSTASSVLSDINMTDLNMMVMTSGRERTIAEYRELFRKVELELVRVVQTQTAMNVMEVRVGIGDQQT